MNNFLSKNKAWLPLLIVLIACGLAYYIIETGKISGKKKRFDSVKKVRVVKVVPLVQQDIIPSWFASGTVKSAESVSIVAQVSGKIEQVNELAQPGALIEKGTWLVKIDPSDYQLNVATQQAQWVQAQANYSLEEADQLLAKEELSLFEGSDKDGLQTALVLREPQLKAAKAKVAVAKANLDKAKLSVERTHVDMPFTGSIVQRNIGRGSRISQNSKLYDVVNIEQFWLEVKVPRQFLSIFDPTANAILSQEKMWPNGVSRTARFVSVLPELDSRDRQAKILLSIEDPLAQNKGNVTQPAIFINDFLTVELKGKVIKDAWLIKSNWLLADNTIWVVDKNNTLQKRNVEVKFKSRSFVYIHANFSAGDRALTEKPGIATVGLSVKPKKVTFDVLKAADNTVSKANKPAKLPEVNNNGLVGKTRAPSNRTELKNKQVKSYQPEVKSS